MICMTDNIVPPINVLFNMYMALKNEKEIQQFDDMKKELEICWEVLEGFLFNEKIQKLIKD